MQNTPDWGSFMVWDGESEYMRVSAKVVAINMGQVLSTSAKSRNARTSPLLFLQMGASKSGQNFTLSETKKIGKRFLVFVLMIQKC